MKEEKFDVIVVGCGAAGLSAAAASAEKGLKVAVLERSSKEERGGQTRYTEAYFRMKAIDQVTDDFEMHLAENAGYYMDPDFEKEMVLDKSSWSQITRSISNPDSEIIMSFADKVPETIQWLQGLGVKFDFLPTQFLTKTQPRLLPVGGGQALVDAMAAYAESKGVSFFYNTTAQKLILDDAGEVAGITAKIVDDGKCNFYGKVVLGSGGFEGNSALLAKYLGPRSVFIRPVCKGGYYNKGEGIEMALEIGAAPCGEFGSYHAEPVDPRSGVSEPSIFIYPYGILINKNGERFCDEANKTVDANYEETTRRIYEQKDGIAYVILDQKVKEISNYRLAIRTDQPAIEGSTLEELSRKLGIPEKNLVQTIEQYNQACQVDKEFKPFELDGLATKNLTPPKSNWARKIDQGPYMAYPIISANVFTFGGLKVNNAAQVVDSDGNAIRNLYASGEVVGMYYNNYTGGTSVLKALVFGKLAAEHIAQLHA